MVNQVKMTEEIIQPRTTSRLRGVSHRRKMTLVLGGTGKTGRRVVARLTAGGFPVRVGSRSGVPPFDWNDSTTWHGALNGVGSVYLSYHPDLAVPGAVETVRSFVRQAVKQGVRRLVLLSGRGEHAAEQCERIVRDSGVDWTIVRSAWFMQNFSEDYLLDAVLAGEVALPVGPVGEPFIDADDIADVAAAALTEDGHQGQLYELTGPRLLTFEQATREIARATGRDIHFVQVPMGQYASVLVDAHLPDQFVALANHLFTEVLDGRNARLADGVQRALRREPRDFADYARKTAATGVWGEVGARREPASHETRAHT